MVAVWKMEIVKVAAAVVAVVFPAMYSYKSMEFWQLTVVVLSIPVELSDWISVSNVYLMRHLSPAIEIEKMEI